MKRLAFLLCGVLAVLPLGIALAASPPVIERVWSWNVGPTTAGLSMSYKNFGQNSRVWFEISTQPNMANAKREAERVVGPSAGSQGHADLNGLKPDTIYYYRAFIRNYDGEVYSGIAQFKTAAGAEKRPPEVSLLSDSVDSSGISFTFSCDAKGSEGSCVARWSTSANMSGAHDFASIHLGAAPGGTAMHGRVSNSGVPDNTRIYVQAEARNANGVARTATREFLIRNKPI